MWSAKKLYWLMQFLGWGAFCLLIGFTKYSQGEFDQNTVYKLFELLLLFIFITHLCRYVMIRFDWLNLKLAQLIPRLITINFLSSVVLVLIDYTSSRFFYRPEDFGFTFTEFFVNTIVYTLFFMLWSAIYLSYHLLNKSRQQEFRNLQLEASNNEIELKTLRDQLNPHFLFNSLNSIRALIEEDPKIAKSAITTLSNLLRRSLNMGKHPKVTLEEELRLVKEYLELEKIRFEERLAVSIRVSADHQLLIPPFIIQTLAENAIKHGISNRNEGGELTILVDETLQALIIHVSNPGKLENEESEGIGLINTKRRLFIQYGEFAKVDLHEEDGLVIATIEIDKKALNSNI
jgi:two-component system, LytTR family, sensor kinase